MNDNAALISDFEHLDAEAVRRMIDRREPESLKLEFKRMTPDGDLSRHDKDNLAKALSGFANSAGGIVLWGGDTSHAEDGNLNAICGVHPIVNPQQKVARLIELSGQLVTPTPDGVCHEVIPWDENRSLIKTLIPASDSAPHRVAGGSGQYYRRSADSFRYMEHYEIADMFGRRARAKLELVVQKPVISPCGHTYPEWPAWQAAVVLCLRNSGRAMARFPAISLDIDRDAGNITLHESAIFGLPRRYQVDGRDNRRGPVILGGGVDDVIHPGQQIDLVRLWLRGYRDGGHVAYIGCPYKLFAEGMPTVEGHIDFDVDRLWADVIQPWANEQYAMGRIGR